MYHSTLPRPVSGPRHRQRPRPTLPAHPGIQMAPFVDVIFVLLLFYMVKLGFQRREGQLFVHLPSANSTAPAGLELQEEIVRIDDRGGLFHNEESVTSAELTAHFNGIQTQCLALHTPLLVTVDADSHVAYAELTGALAALQKSGVHRVTFQVISEE